MQGQCDHNFVEFLRYPVYYNTKLNVRPMRAFDNKPQTVVCHTCGRDITKDDRYHHRTQCSACYWRGQFERLEPLENLLKRCSETSSRLEALPSEIEKQRQAIDAYKEALRKNVPWWRSFLGNWEDQTLQSYSRRLNDLWTELSNLKEEHSRLQWAVKHAKETKKKFLGAEKAQRVKAEQHDKFSSASTSNLSSGFDRTQFDIELHDYRRGNAVDNYFRRIEDTVFSAFGHSCVFCGSSHDLTFDHYGLPKNEGGNFVLILANKASIRLNIVVLCRGCNAAKGTPSPPLFRQCTERASNNLPASIA